MCFEQKIILTELSKIILKESALWNFYSHRKALSGSYDTADITFYTVPKDSILILMCQCVNVEQHATYEILLGI